MLLGSKLPPRNAFDNSKEDTLAIPELVPVLPKEAARSGALSGGVPRAYDPLPELN